MVDNFLGRRAGLESTASDAFAVTPNDGVDLAVSTRALYIGVGGNVKLTTVDGTTVTFVGLNAGQLLPVRAVRIFSTDTTATTILGLV